jgi:hypothetical protein
VVLKNTVFVCGKPRTLILQVEHRIEELDIKMHKTRRVPYHMDANLILVEDLGHHCRAIRVDCECPKLRYAEFFGQHPGFDMESIVITPLERQYDNEGAASKYKHEYTFVSANVIAKYGFQEFVV